MHLQKKKNSSHHQHLKRDRCFGDGDFELVAPSTDRQYYSLLAISMQISFILSPAIGQILSGNAI
jgi:hypothetical protein